MRAGGCLVVFSFGVRVLVAQARSPGFIGSFRTPRLPEQATRTAEPLCHSQVSIILTKSSVEIEVRIVITLMEESASR